MSELTKPVVSGPKPFVFVLMPFDKKFADIYEYGIKGAAEDAGAYAERVDEQIHTDSIYDRIVNQIAKADIIVADMTGKNPNVYYEVGYAHALGKRVFLLTQDAGDIPFDLKHRPHIVYGGEIKLLRERLGRSLVWSVENPELGKMATSPCPIEVWINDVRIPEAGSGGMPQVMFELSGMSHFGGTLLLKNRSPKRFGPIDRLFILTSPGSSFKPGPSPNLQPIFIHTDDDDAAEGFGPRYPIATRILSLSASEICKQAFAASACSGHGPSVARLEVLANDRVYQFDFVPAFPPRAPADF